MGRGSEKIFFQRRHKCSIGTWKGAQHHWSSGKCESKSWNVTSYHVRMACNKKARNNMDWPGYRQKSILVHSQWECKLV